MDAIVKGGKVQFPQIIKICIDEMRILFIYFCVF
jgi:hypothetical protein